MELSYNNVSSTFEQYENKIFAKTRFYCTVKLVFTVIAVLFDYLTDNSV